MTIDELNTLCGGERKTALIAGFSNTKPYAKSFEDPQKWRMTIVRVARGLRDRAHGLNALADKIEASL